MVLEEEGDLRNRAGRLSSNTVDRKGAQWKDKTSRSGSRAQSVVMPIPDVRCPGQEPAWVGTTVFHWTGMCELPWMFGWGFPNRGC